MALSIVRPLSDLVRKLRRTDYTISVCIERKHDWRIALLRGRTPETRISRRVYAQRAIAVLVAGIAIGLPTFRFLPVFYQWVMRRRLIYWYAKLKALEASFGANASARSLPETKIEIERTDQLYNLRSHIDIVRRKIASRANTHGVGISDPAVAAPRTDEVF